MRRVYLETNAVNNLLDGGDSGSKLRRRLELRALEPVVGLHVVYELARTFLSGRADDRARRLFHWLQELDPNYSPGVPNLLEQEVTKLRTGAAVLPFLDHLNQAAIRVEVGRLACGIFDDRARNFITHRESELRSHHPDAFRAYISTNAAIRTQDPSLVPRFESFTDAILHFQPQLAQLIWQNLAPAITHLEAEELAARLDEFPAIRSVVNANLYLSFVAITHEAVPSINHIGDFRHIVEASYSDAFMTADVRLLRVLPAIHSGLDAIEPQAI